MAEKKKEDKWYWGKYAGKAASAVKKALTDKRGRTGHRSLEEQVKSGKKVGGSVSKNVTAGAQRLGIEAKRTVKTKGGKYEEFQKGALKKAKERGKIKQTYGEAFKKNCAGKASSHTFKWTSPSGKEMKYSCKKK